MKKKQDYGPEAPEGTYDCACGKTGFVDLPGEDNRYPCYACYLNMVKPRRTHANHRQGNQVQGPGGMCLRFTRWATCM